MESSTVCSRHRLPPPSRQLLLRCSNFPHPCGSLESSTVCSRHRLPPRRLLQAPFYLPTSLDCLFQTQSTSSLPGVVWVVHPWSRRRLFPTPLYLLPPWSRPCGRMTKRECAAAPPLAVTRRAGGRMSPLIFSLDDPSVAYRLETNFRVIRHGFGGRKQQEHWPALQSVL